MAAYEAHFADRLVAVFVFGSVHRGEAIRNVSDIDLITLLHDDFTSEDRKWRRETEEQLKRKIIGFPNLPRAESVQILFSGLQPEAHEFDRYWSLDWLHRIRHDSTLLWGEDPTTVIQTLTPDLDWARESYRIAHELVRWDAGLGEWAKGGFGPIDPSPAQLRKWARTAALGGTFLLMKRDAFRSFKVCDVIPPLMDAEPEWKPFLEETERRSLALTYTAKEDAKRYLQDLIRWMERIGEELDR